MKVNYISCQDRYCGLGQYTENLAKSTHSQGEVVKAYRKDHGDGRIFRAYPYRSFRKMRPYIAPYFLSKSIKQDEADVWQADYVDASMAAIMAGKRDNLFVTIHDAIPFVHAARDTAFEYYKWQLQMANRHARSIIVVSHHAKKEVVKYTDIAPSRIHVVYNGINHDIFKPASTTDKSDQDYNKKKFSVRYLGGLGVPHKNALALLRTAEIIQKTTDDVIFEIGGYLPENHHLRRAARDLKLKNLVFSGFIKDEDMAGFYQGADLFLFPSLLEGFGFPPLEAMACGVPTIVSDIPVLRETLGEAACFATPTPTSYAEAIINLRHDNTLRYNLVKSGVARAAKYSWDKAATEMKSLYLTKAA